MGDAQVIPIDQGAEEDATDELQPGTTLLHGQYTIESFLNAGGFGITYRARDSLDRPVVIKECFPGAFCRRSRAIVQARSRAHQNELHSIVRLFVQEARSLSKLQHPNIVGVHQVFEENDTAYMALDFVEGRDLLEILDDPKARLDPDQIVSILRDILDAIGFVHDQGVLHRDISPDNILVSSDLRPVLIDFGAARQQATRQTRVLSALRVVKDGYSPQEFYVNGSEQGPYSDLYALGASFYHLIAGETPPDSQVRLTAIATGERDPYEPLRGRFPDYDEAALAAVDKSLAVLPKDRVQSAAEWISIMDGEVEAPAPVATPKLKSKALAADAAPKSNKITLMAGVAAVALMAVGIIVTQSDLFSSDEPAATDAPAAEESSAAQSVEPSVTSEDVAVTTVPDTAEPDAATPVEPEVADAEPPLVPSETRLAGPFAPASSQRPLQAPRAVVADGEDVATVAPREVQTALSAPRPAGDADDPRSTAAEGGILQADTAERAATYRRPDPDVADPRTMLAEAGIRAENHGEAVVAYANRPIAVSTPVPVSDPVVLALSHRDVRVQGQPGDWQALSEKEQIPEGTQGPGTAPIEAVALGAELQPEPEPEVVTTEPEVAQPAPEQPAVEQPVIEAQPQAPQLASNTNGIVRADDIVSSWSLDLPFEDLRTDAEGATLIRAIEGRPVDTREEFEAALQEVYDPLGRTDLTVNIGLGSQSGLTILDQSVTLPIVQTIALPNGLKFEAKADAGGTWVTTLVAAPEGAETDAKVGDIMFAQFPSNERVDARLEMAEILTQATAAGQQEFKFLALRNGGTFFVTITHRGSPTN